MHLHSKLPLLLLFFAVPVSLSAQFTMTDFMNAYTYPEGAFRIDFPCTPTVEASYKEGIAEEGKTVRFKYYVHSCINPGTVHLVIHKTLPIGRTVADAREQLSATLETMRANYKKSSSVFFSEEDDSPVGHLTAEYNGMKLQIKGIIRGNREYYLIYGANNPINRDREKFFQSFRFMPLLYEDLQPYTPSGQPYTIALPVQRSFDDVTDAVQDDKVLAGHMLTAYDSLSGINYRVERTHYRPYAEAESKEVFKNTVLQNVEAHSDLVLLRDTTEDGRMVFYSEELQSGTTCRTLYKSILDGDSFYDLMVIIPHSNQLVKAEEFFAGFQPQSPLPKDYIFLPKGKIILENLISPDTETHRQAGEVLDKYRLSAADLPVIYDYLENKKYLRDTTERLLLREFRFNSDAGTVEYLADYFTRSEERDIRFEILTALPYTDSLGRRVFFDKAKTWQKDATEALYDYEIAFAAFDSLEIFNAHIDDLMSLYDNPQFRYRAVRKLMDMADESNVEQYAAYRDFFLSEGKRYIAENRLFDKRRAKNNFDEYYTFDAINFILTYLESTPEIEEYFKSFKDISDPYLVLTAIRYYAYNQIPLDERMVRTAYESEYQRIFMYAYAFDAFGTTEVLPADLCKPGTVVKSYVYNRLGNEYGPLLSYKIIKTKPYRKDNQDLLLNLFTFRLQNYEGSYLGVISQPADGKVNPYPTIFNYHTDPWKKKETEAMLAEMLEEAEKKE